MLCDNRLIVLVCVYACVAKCSPWRLFKQNPIRPTAPPLSGPLKSSQRSSRYSTLFNSLAHRNEHKIRVSVFALLVMMQNALLNSEDKSFKTGCVAFRLELKTRALALVYFKCGNLKNKENSQ